MTGRNNIKIESPGDTGAIAEISWLDSILIYYPGESIPVDDRMDYFGEGDQISFEGFSGNVDIFDFSNPDQPILLDEGFTKNSFWQSSPQKNYRIIGPKGYFSPKRLEPYFDLPNLKALGNGADYLMIVPDDWVDEVQALKQLRKAKDSKLL